MLLKNISARLGLAFAALALAAFAALPAHAQEEAPPVVLDEPVAQVDNYVIMLSQLKRENNEFREVLVKQRGMTPEQAEAELQRKQPEIILNLINEALLVQKGKDIPASPRRSRPRSTARCCASPSSRTSRPLRSWRRR